MEQSGSSEGVDSFVQAVAANVRALRMQAGLTLADLAGAAGLGKSTLARASDVPAVHSAETPGWAGRLLTASHARSSFDLYALDLEAGAVRHADPHHAGVVEHLVVATGRLRAGPQVGPVLLNAGDLLTFGADVPHVYEALETTHCVLLMAYP